MNKNRCSRALALAILAGSAFPAVANPDGGDVVEGSAEFIFGEDYLRILTGEITIIDWLNFNIDAGYTVEFLMPGVDSRVLNRITSGVPTEIMGNLLANGQVFIVNPSGVIFGQNAVVNVGALYAAAGNLSNADFVAGVNRFTDARGIVENRGHLQGDLIALVGGRVANHGTISAPNGTVVMAAGEQVLIGEHLGNVYVQIEAPSSPDADLLGSSGDAGLDLAAGDVFSLAAWNTGTIEGGSVTVHGGGGRNVISGTIEARRGDIGGDVTLLGHTVELRGATVDASGDRGGGSIVIGGNPHLDVNADRSMYVEIDPDSVVSADALVAGDGGSVVVWSDQRTTVDGSITARGGAVSGDGGFIETSGLRGLRISRMVDATAVNGAGGHWLIDPTNIIIAPGSLGSLGGFGGDTAVIGVNLINQALNAGMDVTLTTFNPLGNGSGEIIQMETAAFRLFSGVSSTLTLNASGSILLHGGAFATNGSSLSLVLNAGDPNQPPPADPFSNGRIEINEVLSLGGGSLWATGNSVLVRTRNISDTGTVFVDAGDISLVARDGGDIFLGADMTAASGMLLDGRTTLINDVNLTLTGAGEILATGVIRSADDAFHDLTIDAGPGVVTLAGGVGDAGAGRLGDLSLTASLARIGADVRTLGDMNFFAPVAVFGESVTFHTGLGTALFAGDVFSERFGFSDVAFEYDGDAWAGVGEGRTPFKFRGSIGAFGFGVPRGDGGGGAFRTIRFGTDLAGSPSVATFLFANGAVSGLELTSLGATDLSSLFRIVATESITMGRGQKITSFGSLSMLAQGADSTLIEVGDLNVVGDLSIRSLGADGQIRLLGRVAGGIDGQGNEGDRDTPAVQDGGAELIASGSITLDGVLAVDGGAATIGANQVILANETGGSALGLPIEIIEGGAGIDRFTGTLKGTEGLLYAYDLAAFASVDPEPPTESVAVLGEALNTDPDVDIRSDERFLADERVLGELGLSVRDFGGDRLQPDGTRGIIVDSMDLGVVTVDRLSRTSVRRLGRAFVALLGEEIDGVDQRPETVRVRQELASLWSAWNDAGRPEDIAAFAAQWDEQSAETLWGLTRVMMSIDLLELSPREIDRARTRMLEIALPGTVDRDDVGRAWFPRRVDRVAVRGS